MVRGSGNIGPEQADIKLVCRGLGHGNTHAIVLAPATPQEMLDIAMLAFELAFKYRNPVVIVGDGYLGQMTGKVTLPREMVVPGIPEWAVFGDRSHRGNLICSINLSEVDLEQHNIAPEREVRPDRPPPSSGPTSIAATTPMSLLVACNTPAQLAKGAIKELRDKGLKVGLFRPITLWPFPIDALSRPARRRRGASSSWRRAAGSSRTSCGWRSATPDVHAPPPISHVRRMGGILPSQGEIVEHVLGSGGGALMPTSVFYREFERHAHGEGVNAHSTTYCPGCGHGLAQKYLAEAIDELGVQDRTVLVSPVGCSVFMLLLLRRREHPGGARARPGGGDRPQDGEPGLDRDLLPGRRRPRLDRSGRDRQHGPARDPDHGHLHQQRHLRDDRRPDGSHDPARPANDARRRRAGRSCAGQPLKMAELIVGLDGPVYVERVALYDNKRRTHARRAIKKALELQVAGQRLRLHRGPLRVPALPRPRARGRRGLGAGQHGAGLPARGEEGHHRRRRPSRSSRRRTYDPESRPWAPLDATIERPPRFADGFPTHIDPEDISFKLAGSGGDGAQTAAMILTRAAINEGFDSTHIPSYGPESRGGTSYADVHVARKEVLSPAAPHPHVLVAFNAPSLAKFGPTVRPAGWSSTTARSSAVQPEGFAAGVKAVAVPFAGVAKDLGPPLVKNVVALGALQGATKVFPEETFLTAIRAALKQKCAMIPINEEAFRGGRQARRRAPRVGGRRRTGRPGPPARRGARRARHATSRGWRCPTRPGRPASLPGSRPNRADAGNFASGGM